MGEIILFVVLLAGGLGLAVTLWLAFSREVSRLDGRNRSMESRFESEWAILRSQIASLSLSIPPVASDRQPYNQVVAPGDMDRRIGRLEHLLEGWDKLIPSTSANLRSPSPRIPTSSLLSREETALVAVVNRWWSSHKPDRAEIEHLAAAVHLSVFWYAIRDIETSLQSISWNGPYRFSPSDKDGGWLFSQIEGTNDVFALPADPAYFQTASIRSLVTRMFDLDGDSRSPMSRSGMVLRACRFRRVAHEDQYVVVSRGTLSDGSTSANCPVVPYEDLVRSGAGGNPSRFQYSTAAQELTLPQVLESRLRTVGEELAASNSKLSLVRQDCESLQTKLREIERSESTRAAVTAVPPVAHTPLPIAAMARRIDAVQQELRSLAQRLATLEKTEEFARSATNGASWSDLPSEWSSVFSLPPGSGVDGADNSSPAHHLARLLDAQSALATFLGLSGLPLVPELVHLAVEGDLFSLHKVTLTDECEDRQVYCIDCQRPLADQLLFQLFLAVQDNDESTHIFLPPGTFTGCKFPRGYQLLLEQVPAGTVCLTSVLQPACLIKAGHLSGYRVSTRMRVSYQEQGGAVVKPAIAGLVSSRSAPSNGNTADMGVLRRPLPANATP
jgi:hypothetical protein